MQLSYDNVGSTIKKIRESQKLTQNELSKLSGISRSYLAVIELNTKKPSFETLKKLAEALNVPVNVFLEDITDIKKEEETKTIELINNLIKNSKNDKIRWINEFEALKRKFVKLEQINNIEEWQKKALYYTTIYLNTYVLFPEIVSTKISSDESVDYKKISLYIFGIDTIYCIGDTEQYENINTLYKIANNKINNKNNDMLEKLLNEIYLFEDGSETPF